MSSYRALDTAEGEERSRDSSIESSRRSDDKEASTRYLIVLTCSTGGYVTLMGLEPPLHRAHIVILGCRLYGL